MFLTEQVEDKHTHKFISLDDLSIGKTITSFGEGHETYTVNYTIKETKLTDTWNGRDGNEYSKTSNIPKAYIEHFMKTHRNDKLIKILN